MEEERTVSSQRVFQGRLIGVRVDTVALPGGRQGQREIVEHGTSVVVAPLTANGEVVLVRQYRKAAGVPLLEAPAGGMDAGETPEDAVARELREETGLKLPEPVLRGSIKDRQVFDHPTRSLRGRTITHACLFNFPTGELPRVKGSDDADKARWVPLNEFAQMRNVMFEDHFDIAYHFLGKL